MGNGAARQNLPPNGIYIQLPNGGQIEKLVYGQYSSSRDLQEMIALACGLPRTTMLTLKDTKGVIVGIGPDMPQNTRETVYKVEIKAIPASLQTGNMIMAGNNAAGAQTGGGGKQQPGQDAAVSNGGARSGANNKTYSSDTSTEKVVEQVLLQVSEQFNRAFQMEELRNALDVKIRQLEQRMDLDGLKSVEIDKCKKEIADLRHQVHTVTHNNNHHHHHRILSADSHRRQSSYDGSGSGSIGDIERKLKIKDMPTYPKYTLSEETIEYLKKPTFDVWHWEPNEMLSLLEHMYHELGLVHEFQINPITLKRWLLCVQASYRNNPFHNFRHCFCVTQMMYGIMHICKLWEKISRFDLGILLTACVCHDLDHPGYNNAYQINARTELALRYNDQSPLENHHCAVAFQVFAQPETNIFANVNHDQFKYIRDTMIKLILATDMSKHGEILDDFRAKLKAGFDFRNAEHTLQLKKVLIKCCDISNEVRPMDVSEPWLELLLEEYFNQSDREKAEGLPVAPFMDREKVTKASAQIGFIKFVLIPLFNAVGQLLPSCKELEMSLQQALKFYEELKGKEDAEKARAPAAAAAQPPPQSAAPSSTATTATTTTSAQVESNKANIRRQNTATTGAAAAASADGDSGTEEVTADIDVHEPKDGKVISGM